MNAQPPTPPLLRLDFYSTAVLMTQYRPDGRCLSYPVSIDDVARVFTDADLPLRSGLLPPNILHWSQRGSAHAAAIYQPARRWHMQTAQKNYHIPMPPLIFIGRDRSYRVYATKSKQHPQNPQERLFLAPMPNVHATGEICAGGAPFPACAPQTIYDALLLFMEGSNFNNDLATNKAASHRDNILDLWEEIDGRTRFPISKLIPMPLTLESALTL